MINLLRRLFGRDEFWLIDGDQGIEIYRSREFTIKRLGYLTNFTVGKWYRDEMGYSSLGTVGMNGPFSSAEREAEFRRHVIKRVMEL